MKKTFVLDTNILIHNPYSIFSFGDNIVVLPITVIEEIDNFKKGLDEKGRNARETGRLIDKIRNSKKGNLKNGVALENGGTLKISFALKEAEEEIINKFHFKNVNDNLIIGAAYTLHREILKKNLDEKVILISQDANVRIKADALGLTAQDYESEKVKFDEIYAGIKEVPVPGQVFEEFKKNRLMNNKDFQLLPNQFIKFINENNNQEFAIGKNNEKEKVIYPLTYDYKQEVFGLTPRNIEQTCAMELLLDRSIRLVSLLGIAGTGKTLLALAAGMEQVVEKNFYKKLVVSRPIFPLGKDLGYLPGNKKDKFSPWMQPIYDNMETLVHLKENKTMPSRNNNFRKHKGENKVSLEDFIDFGVLELEPLTYIRGRSLPNQYLIIDEAQNLTPHEIKTIITRAGKDTKIVLTGDPYQIDIPYLDSESNGLSIAVEKLKTEKLVGHITLQKGERSELAEIATKYF